MRRQIEKFCNVFYIYKNYKMRVTVQIHKTAAKNKNVLLNWFCVVPVEDGHTGAAEMTPGGGSSWLVTGGRTRQEGRGRPEEEEEDEPADG